MSHSNLWKTLTWPNHLPRVLTSDLCRRREHTYELTCGLFGRQHGTTLTIYPYSTTCRQVKLHLRRWNPQLTQATLHIH